MSSTDNDGAGVSPRAAVGPLEIRVTNGDLTFEPRPLLLGHYRSARLTGTERVMNRAIGGTMAQSLDVRLYPDAPGTQQIFINRRVDPERGGIPRPRAVIVAGLGEEGRLQAAQLVLTVRQAVIAWAQRLSDESKTEPFELAAALIGSGGTRVTPGESARLIAQGVQQANEVLTAKGAGWPIVNRLVLIELYLDRAADAWRALRLEEAAAPSRYRVADAVQQGTGALLRPLDSGYRGTDYDFISIDTRTRAGEARIAYTLDTRRARSEVRGQRAQSALVRELVRTASNDLSRDARIGRTLFNLLVPLELEAYLAASGEMQMQLDAGTAPIPWELLEPPGDERADRRPWAIRVKLLRKLRLDVFRENVLDADREASVLVVGEPACPPEYPPLAGARREAIAVRDRLCGPSGLPPDSVRALVETGGSAPGPDAQTVINALFEKPWRIIHVSGHGMPAEAGRSGGVVLSTGFLGPDEIRTMRSVPELVFVNCCYLAASDPSRTLARSFDRVAFASSVAGSLIAIGVRCVVAAGWAVDDEAAQAFAEAFYDSLLRGNRFIVAVADARERAYQVGGGTNTWAAYQCYGDPDWVLRRDGAGERAGLLPDDYSNVGTEVSLSLALDRIIVQTVHQGRDLEEQRRSLLELERQFAAQWAHKGAVAERFAQAFVELGDVETGIAWYERAMEAPDGLASLKAAERLANARSRRGWEIVDAARRASANGGFDAEARRGRDLIEQALALLTHLAAIRATPDRFILVGAARKRQALVSRVLGHSAEVETALGRMKASYEEAVRLGLERGEEDLFHPMSNALVAELALNAGRPDWPGIPADQFRSLRAVLARRNEDVADFWSVVSEPELDQYQAIGDHVLARFLSVIQLRYRNLHELVNAPWRWSSVFDTASLVLGGYADRVDGAERQAAAALLAQLEEYAHPGR